jgi:hypothetical protein
VTDLCSHYGVAHFAQVLEMFLRIQSRMNGTGLRTRLMIFSQVKSSKNKELYVDYYRQNQR